MLQINDHGRVMIHKPFSIPDLVYTVSGKLLLADLVASGVDIYSLVYAPAGFTEEQFNRTTVDNPIMLILKGTDGTIQYAPEEYVLIQDDNFKEYVEKAVLLGLGPIEANDDLKPIVKSLEDTIVHSMGIKPSVLVENISTSIPVSEKEHTMIVRDRKKLSNITGSLEQQLESYKDHNKILIAQVNSLLMFIKHYLRTCCSKDICFNYSEGRIPEYIYYKHEINHYVAVQASGGNPFSGETNAWLSYLRRWHKPDQI